MMHKQIQFYTYLNDYFNKIHNHYDFNFPGINVVYYSMNKANSVFDDAVLTGGTYEELGSLSGLYYSRILMFPMFVAEAATPEQEAGERGIEIKAESTFLVPDSVGIKPCPSDYFFIPNSFDMENSKSGGILYVITAVEDMSLINRTFYRCRYENSPYKILDVEKHVSSGFVFVDRKKKIIDENLALLSIISLENYHEILSEARDILFFK